MVPCLVSAFSDFRTFFHATEFCAGVWGQHNMVHLSTSILITAFEGITLPRILVFQPTSSVSTAAHGLM